MAYDYIKKNYSFAPEVGKRVRHTETKRTGVIGRESPSAGHYVQVKFDGQKFNLPCHPNSLEYVSE